MINEIKILLGDAAANYTDELIQVYISRVSAEVEAYCNRKLDKELEAVIADLVVLKLNRQNTEGLASQSFSGVNESYIDGYPANILAILNRKRKVKLL